MGPTQNYNLLEEAWISVLYRNGVSKRVSLLEALAQASQIREIAASNPMDRLALLRFLLALLYWCNGNPPGGEDLVPRRSFSSSLFKKLDENKHCFSLLGKGERFYQDRSAKRTRPATVLVQELPAGNNFWHLGHSMDNKSGLCQACCVMGLLRLPLFAVSGLSGPGEPNLMAGINGVPPVYAAPWGKSLFETLLANWTPRGNLGEPSWFHRRSSKDADADVPLLAGLTLLPRRVLLHDPVKTGEACAGCGARGLSLIFNCEYQTAGKLENPKWRDPYALYVSNESPKTMRAADLTASGRFRMDRPWPNLLAHVLETRKPGLLFVVGFATNKAKNVDVWERIINIPPGASASGAASSLAKNWQSEGRRLEEEIKRITRSDNAGAAITSSVRPAIESRVSEKMGELVSQGNAMWEQAALEYTPRMVDVAKSLSPGYSIAALRRRRQLSGLKPDMRPKSSGADKGGRNKGGGK